EKHTRITVYTTVVNGKRRSQYNNVQCVGDDICQIIGSAQKFKLHNCQTGEYFYKRSGFGRNITPWHEREQHNKRYDGENKYTPQHLICSLGYVFIRNLGV